MAPKPTKAPAEKDRATKNEAQGGILTTIREWGDAILVAFLLAMFIRIFVVELFKIPSPSMTPTLLGTQPPRQGMIFEDLNQDGAEDMVLFSNGHFDYYEKGPDRYVYEGEVHPGPMGRNWLRQAEQRQDRILVGKFFYWFSPPDRGDIVVFKVPPHIFEPAKPIYIKRVVGLPGETLSFEPAPGVPGHLNSMGYLKANGERVTQPAFFESQRYEYRNIGGIFQEKIPDYASYKDRGLSADLVEVNVPENHVYVFGDNTVSSRDSRYWGGVPFAHLRGRAVFRYFKNPAFLH